MPLEQLGVKCLAQEHSRFESRSLTPKACVLSNAPSLLIIDDYFVCHYFCCVYALQSLQQSTLKLRDSGTGTGKERYGTENRQGDWEDKQVMERVTQR